MVLLKKTVLFVWIALLLFFPLYPAFAQESTDNQTSATGKNVDPVVKKKSEQKEHFLVYPVKLFQKYISGADGNRCPMYPSCSNYCIHAFEKHGVVMGWIMTCDRLLRCGRDELKLSQKIRIGKKKHAADTVEDNDFWW